MMAASAATGDLRKSGPARQRQRPANWARTVARHGVFLFSELAAHRDKGLGDHGAGMIPIPRRCQPRGLPPQGPLQAILPSPKSDPPTPGEINHMLSVFPPARDAPEGEFAVVADALWVDLFNPTPEETAGVAATIGTAVPSEWALSEIEPSSRLRVRDGVLFMSTPSAIHRRPDAVVVAPIGFVLSKERLVTVRYTPMPAFEAVAAKFQPGRTTPTTSLDVFVELVDEIVDRVADALEETNAELSGLSIEAFQKDHLRGRDPNRSTTLLRVQLRQVGRIGDRLSDIRNGLLGVARVVNFVDQFCAEWTDGVARSRLISIRNDVTALGEYEEHLATKNQFVLDALVGLISIAQNDIFKVLTIVSIVGIPPTLMAGVYGMNFEHMPEYHWTYGYEWGWGVIIVSAIIPLVWFKLKGWF